MSDYEGMAVPPSGPYTAAEVELGTLYFIEGIESLGPLLVIEKGDTGMTLARPFIRNESIHSCRVTGKILWSLSFEPMYYPFSDGRRQFKSF